MNYFQWQPLVCAIILSPVSIHHSYNIVIQTCFKYHWIFLMTVPVKVGTKEEHLFQNLYTWWEHIYPVNNLPITIFNVNELWSLRLVYLWLDAYIVIQQKLKVYSYPFIRVYLPDNFCTIAKGVDIHCWCDTNNVWSPGYYIQIQSQLNNVALLCRTIMY